MPRFDVVVSTENNGYLVWQAMLFHYSCVRHLGQSPIIVVHKSDEPLLPGFQRIAAAGGIVQTAPNYRRLAGVNYPPRNTAATLRHVESTADYLILCDPDMIFLQPLPLEHLALTARQVSFDQLTYLDPDCDAFQPALDTVCRRAGVAAEKLREQPINGGVPHIIPAGLRRELSDEWLACIELFPTIAPWPADVAGALSRECHVGPQKDWMATMWAVVLAVHRLGLEPVMTSWCISNYQGDKSLPAVELAGAKMIHYCYADVGFNKHAFDSTLAAEEHVWNVAAGDGTIGGAIRQQLREGRVFYGMKSG